MSDNGDPDAGKKTATQALAELVARRKADAGGQASSEKTRRGSERAAAARSASKSKPAMRK